MSIYRFALISIAAIGCGDNLQITPHPDGPGMTQCAATSAAPLVFGATLALTGNGVAYASAGDQPPLLEKTINDGCGLIGNDRGGTPVHFVVLDSQDAPVVAPATIDQLV